MTDEGRCIILRAPESADIAAIYGLENDAAGWRWSATRGYISLKRIADYVENYNSDAFAAGELRLMITDRATGCVTGCVDLFEVDAVNRRAGVGIVIDRQYRRQGYASAALEELRRYAGEMLGLHQLWAIVAADNEASRVLFSAAGYKTGGRLKSWIRVGRSYVDAYIYQIML